MAYRVTDIDAACAALREKGLRLLYDAPRRGTADSRINFVHPKDAGGVLVELVQPAPPVCTDRGGRPPEWAGNPCRTGRCGAGVHSAGTDLLTVRAPARSAPSGKTDAWHGSQYRRKHRRSTSARLRY